MVSIFTIIFFIFGIIIGSFLNVVIFRMNTGRSLGGRSACMSCKNTLRFHELIPLFSFLGLQGRCRNCKTKISIQYPLVEFMTGLVFVVLFLRYKDIFFNDTLWFAFTYAYYALMFSILIVIAVYDLRHKIIPDKFSFTFGLLAFCGMFLFIPGLGFGVGASFHIPTLLGFLTGPLVALPFLLLWLVSRGAWIGLGDGKLALGLGWFLGLANALSGIVLAFWSGAIVGLFLIFMRKGYGMKSEIPFALYLVFGAFSAFIFNLNLFNL